MHRSKIWASAVLATAAVCSATDAAVQVDSNTFGGLQARSIGPAVMGGRIAALDAVWIDDTLTVYVGTATGGLWKSDDGVTSFEPIFDDHTMSIGAVTTA